MNLTSSFNELNDTEIISTTGNIATMLANLTSQMTFAEDLSLSVDIVTSLNEYGYINIIYKYLLYNTQNVPVVLQKQ